MPTLRISTLLLASIFCLLLGVLVVNQEFLLEAHIDESIQYVASDASTYFRAYEALEPGLELIEATELFLVGSPILFMKLSNGNLFLIQFIQLALMFFSLRVGADCFQTLRGRVAFVAGAFVFPYFLFGPLSLNKEIYAMCAAIFFASYVVQGKKWHLLTALILAMLCRYYMLVALVTLLFLVPRVGRPRYWLIGVFLIVLSTAAPIIKTLVPAYSSEGLLEAPSMIGYFFATGIDSFGYALIYPIKYVALIPMRAYSFLIGEERSANAMEGIVSLLSLVMLLLASYIVLLRKPASALVKRFILIAFVAPIPIMWSEIMHWRYYSFVYFFFLFAVVLHFIDRPSRLQVEAAHE